MKEHSIIDKFLHRFYLRNYTISRYTLEYELDKYRKVIDAMNTHETVFVSGLARSGTTVFMREIHQTEKYASLQYNNMPFLFLPNTHKVKSNGKPTERFHKDNIKVNMSSPEEFDEYYWKVFTKDSFIKRDSLNVHDIPNDVLEKYQLYTKLVSLSKNKPHYVTKNNNNILRIKSLEKIPNSIFFFLIRDPLDHASSLMKLHLKFSNYHKTDYFSREYFNSLGHYEFGLDHKPFNLIQSHFDEIIREKNENLDYWLLIWKQYYTYLNNIISTNHCLVFYEDLINRKSTLFKEVERKLNIKLRTPSDTYSPPNYPEYDSPILDECRVIYSKLKMKSFV